MRFFVAWLLAAVLVAASAHATSTTTTYPVNVRPAVAVGRFSTFHVIGTGVPSAPQTVTVTNSGSVSVGVASVAVTGANAGDFSITSNTCSSSLASGASCTVQVKFTASSTVSEAATLNVTGTSGHVYPSVLGGIAAVATSITFTPTGADIQVGTPAGTVLASANVTMSDGSSPTGETMVSSDTSFFAVSGFNLVTARDVVAADAGVDFTTTISVSP
jgi:hypothetical protein